MALTLPRSWVSVAPGHFSRRCAPADPHGPRSLGAAAMLVHGAFRVLGVRRMPMNKSMNVNRMSSMYSDVATNP